MTKLIGLAGKPGSGKSAVGRALASRPGIEWIDLDRVAWETYASGTGTFDRVVARFGEAVVDACGEIDRGELAVRVFLDPAAKEDLEAIVHPAVVERLEALRAEHDRRGTAYLIAEGALLATSRHVEASAFDAVVWLDAPDGVRRARLAAERRVGHAARGDDLSPRPGAIIVDADGTVAEVADRVWRAISDL